MLERVDEQTVVLDWLTLEKEKRDLSFDERELSPQQQRERLRTLWTPPRWKRGSLSYVWYRGDLTESMLNSLYHWIGFRIMDLARAIQQDYSGPEWQERLGPLDIERIESMADALPTPLNSPLIMRSALRQPPTLIDGNHRATAITLHLLRSMEFASIEVYLGFEAYSRVTPILGRLQAQWFQYRHYREDPDPSTGE